MGKLVLALGLSFALILPAALFAQDQPKTAASIWNAYTPDQKMSYTAGFINGLLFASRMLDPKDGNFSSTETRAALTLYTSRVNLDFPNEL